MRSFIAYFKVRFYSMIQYRRAAFFGFLTQFCWGFFEIFLIKALLENNIGNSTISISNMVTYIWLREGLLMLHFIYGEDQSIYEDIITGDVLLDIIKPIDAYGIWFSKNLGFRFSKALARSLPMFIAALLLPKGYRLQMPSSFAHFLLFLISLLLTLFMVISINMYVISIVLRIIDSNGIRIIMSIIVDFLSGNEIPLFFYPENLRMFLSYLPTGNLLYVTNRIYFGDFTIRESLMKIVLQILWLLLLFFTGRYLLNKSLKKVIVQGG